MGDSTKYGNAVDFEVDLHSVYAAYLGQFESAGTEWWDRSWGGYFGTFNDFLSFGWEVMVVVDSATGRAHIAVRPDQITLFAKMIRNRFGESLSKLPPTTLPLSPVPTRTLSLRRLLTISDLAAYRKLALSLASAELSNLRSRARAGDVGLAEQFFYAGGSPAEQPERERTGVRDNGAGYTFACVKTTYWEKGGAPGGIIPGQGRVNGGREGGQVVGSNREGNTDRMASGANKVGKTGGLVLEVGMATMRCAHLRGVDVWPPVPAENYRKSHYIVEEWVDKRTNTGPPSYPRAYAFGKSQWIPEKSLERIMDANLAALSSQENDASPNTLILLTTGEPGPVPLPTWSTLPTNIIHLDILALEHNLLRRAQEAGHPGTPDRHTPLPSLGALLQTLQIPVPAFAPLGNAGNEAYYTLLAFQKLMMAETRLPDLLFAQPHTQAHEFGYVGINGMNGIGSMGSMGSMGNLSGMNGMGGMGMQNMGMGYGIPNSGSMVFNAHTLPTHSSQSFSPLPPPQAPFAQHSSRSHSHSHSHSRRGSSSSPRHSGEIMPPPSIPTSRSGTHSGSRSPADNSPRRQSGALPPNIRRASESFSSVSAGQRPRPTSVPHHNSFGEGGEKESQRAMPIRSAMRGSSSNVNVTSPGGGPVGSNVGAQGRGSGSNSAVGSRTVSWSGPPPVEMDIPEGVGVLRHQAAVRSGSLPDGYEAPEYMAAAAPAQRGAQGQSPSQISVQTNTGGYVNGHGNSYTRSPVMLSSTRSRSSDYFGRNGGGNGGSAGGLNGSASALQVDGADGADGYGHGSSSPRPSRLSGHGRSDSGQLHSPDRSSSIPHAQVQQQMGSMALDQSTGSLGSGSGLGANTGLATAPGSTAPSVAPSASTGTGAHRSFVSASGMAMSAGLRGDGSNGSGDGSGSGSAPGSHSHPSVSASASASASISAGSGSAGGYAQPHRDSHGDHSEPNASVGKGNNNVRALSRSNLSAMLHGGKDRPDASAGNGNGNVNGIGADEVLKASRQKSRDALKDTKVLSKKDKEGKEGKEGKMKSEKSMKNVAGALARFWVG